ncbi:MAG TPA: 50S ribosomal protein L25 [Clostridiales bacterium]|nr:50S ribosomal protein L25 [Clostridiales bacterium]
MELLSLKASPRVPQKGVTKRLRREGFLPVVLYGGGTESRPLKVETKAFERILAGAAGRNALIRLEIEGETADESPTVIIRDLQSDPVRGRYIHADLQRISLKEKMRTHVRLVVVGEEAVARRGGIVQHQMREVEVECLPTDLPDHITVDIGDKEIGDTVTLGDLPEPEGVRFLGDPASVVVAVVPPKMVAGEEEEAEAAEEAAAPEGEGAEAAEGGAEPASKE